MKIVKISYIAYIQFNVYTNGIFDGITLTHNYQP